MTYREDAVRVRARAAAGRVGGGGTHCCAAAGPLLRRVRGAVQGRLLHAAALDNARRARGGRARGGCRGGARGVVRRRAPPHSLPLRDRARVPVLVQLREGARRVALLRQRLVTWGRAPLCPVVRAGVSAPSPSCAAARVAWLPPCPAFSCARPRALNLMSFDSVCSLRRRSCTRTRWRHTRSPRRTTSSSFARGPSRRARCGRCGTRYGGGSCELGVQYPCGRAAAAAAPCARGPPLLRRCFRC